MSSSLKKLVKEAKLRMSKNEYGEEPEKICLIHKESEALINTEELRIERIVSEIAASDEIVLNPISKLIERERFLTMGEEQRERYILFLAESYRRLINKYNNYREKAN